MGLISDGIPTATANGIYLFGEKSKLANWILNHPFHIIGVVLAILSLTTVRDWVFFLRTLWIDAFLFGLAVLIRFFCRNLCYWVIIDTVSEKITLYRCFNKGIVEAPLRSVEFTFDRHFGCYYAGERFTIMNEYMSGIADVLPPGMEIRFSEGFYGRFMKRQCERYRHPKRL